MPPDEPERDSSSWPSYRRLVLDHLEQTAQRLGRIESKIDAEITTLRSEIVTIRAEVARLKTELAVLRTRSLVVSAVGSALLAGVVAAVVSYLTR